MKRPAHREVDSARLARLRQGLYRFFGAAFLYPERERLETLCYAPAVLEGVEDFGFYPFWQRLVQDLPEVLRQERTGLEEEYVRLFLVNTEEGASLPHESTYLARPGQSTGMLIAQLDQEYARLGLTLSAAMRNISDHVSIEMEVMAFLCNREAEAWAKKDLQEAGQALEQQFTFLKPHLGRWFPLFTRRVTLNTSPESFYQLLVNAANAFIHHDLDLLPLLITTLQKQTGVQYAKP